MIRKLFIDTEMPNDQLLKLIGLALEYDLECVVDDVVNYHYLKEQQGLSVVYYRFPHIKSGLVWYRIIFHNCNPKYDSLDEVMVTLKNYITEANCVE